MAPALESRTAPACCIEASRLESIFSESMVEPPLPVNAMLLELKDQLAPLPLIVPAVVIVPGVSSVSAHRSSESNRSPG